jgi:diguanylate cyclase (GGDEF)-like protein
MVVRARIAGVMVIGPNERRAWLEEDKLTTLVRRAAPPCMTGIAIILLLAAVSRGALRTDTPPLALALLLFSSTTTASAALVVRRMSSRTRISAFYVWSIATVFCISIPLSIVSSLTGDHQAIVYCMFGAVMGSVFWLNLRHAIAAHAGFLLPPLVEVATRDPGVWEWRIAVQISLIGTFVSFSMYLLMQFYHRQTTLMSQELHTRASTDGLTQVLNKSAWRHEAGGRLALYAMEDRPASLIFLDLDNFKRINDELGHLTGDLILRRLSETIRECVHEGHLVGRFGGDEFVLLLEDARLEACGEVARRLEREVRASMGVGQHAVSVSMGMAEWDGAETLDDLVLRADINMLARKRQRAAPIDRAVDTLQPGALPA